jgi:hypothetical protein
MSHDRSEDECNGYQPSPTLLRKPGGDGDKRYRMAQSTLQVDSSLVPSKAEMDSLRCRKDEATLKSNLSKARALMIRCAEKLRQGIFLIHPVVNDRDVLCLLTDIYEREGWEVEIITKDKKSRSIKKKTFSYKHVSLKFTPPK